MGATTKYLIAEQVQKLLKGGNPTAASTVTILAIKKAVEQQINTMLKAQQFSVNMPAGETIPDGLTILTYDSVPVERYKNILSRAALPAMPISLPRNMGVWHVSPAIQDLDTTIAIEATDADKPEAPQGTTAFTFTVNRTEDLSGQVSFFYTVSGYGGSPATADDFGGTYPYGQVTFLPTESSKVITINVIGTGIAVSRQFLVTISNPTPSTTIIGTATAIGTIQDSFDERITEDGDERITQDSNIRITQ